MSLCPLMNPESRQPGAPAKDSSSDSLTDGNNKRSCVRIAIGTVKEPLRRVMSPRNDDAELVKKASGGDKDAYRGLVEKYQQRVFSIALEVVRSREDAEDIAQEVFVKAYLSLPDFKGQSSFYTWLYRIAYNMAVDFRRRVQRRGGPPVEYDEAKLGKISDDAINQNRFDGPHDFVMRKEESHQIQKVLSEISPEHRAVITLREIEGLSYDEIADVLRVSKGTVMSRLHYARKRLQQALVALGLRSAVPETETENAQAEREPMISVKTN